MIDSKMVPMGMEQFSKGQPLLSDVFIRLHADKYVQIGKKGQPCHLDEMHAIQDRKIKTLFVLKDWLKDFLANSLLKLSSSTITNENLVEKFGEIIASTDLALKEIQFMGLTSESLNNLKIVTKSLREFTKLSPQVVELVYKFKDLPGNLSNHSACVSALSVLVGTEMGWNSENMLDKLALGGLLHDIGLQKNPVAILRKSYENMSVEEKQTYETHPYFGAQMLRNIPGVPSEVISIVYEHHENSLGEGFPRRLNDVKMHPLSKVVALVDHFTELVVPRTDEEPLKPIQALNYLENVLGQPYNSDCMKAFKKIFGKV